jgi:transposase
MPLSISIDLRKRVLKAVDDGAETIKSIAERFAVGERTIFSWLKLRTTTNDIVPRSNYQKGHSHTIIDWQAFKVFVAQHVHLTAPAMCIEWEKLNGRSISKSVMKRGLQKLGYTFKKKNFTIQNRIHVKGKPFYVKLIQ